MSQDEPPLRENDNANELYDLPGVGRFLRLSPRKILLRHISPIPLPGLYLVHDYNTFNCVYHSIGNQIE
jgi:hypothetical protein